MALIDDFAPTLKEALVEAFGVEVTYLPEAGGSYVLEGTKKQPFEQATFGERAVVIQLDKESLPVAPSQGDSFVMGGVTYRVVDYKETRIGFWKVTGDSN